MNKHGLCPFPYRNLADVLLSDKKTTGEVHPNGCPSALPSSVLAGVIYRLSGLVFFEDNDFDCTVWVEVKSCCAAS